MPDERIAALADKQELAELTARFCRGVDRGDESLILSCFHADGRDDHGPTIASPADFAARIVPLVRSYSAWHHQLGNQLFELRGDEAFGETYFTFHSVTAEGAQGFSCFGRYIDHFERRDGEWRILRRSVVLDWKGQVTAESQSLAGWATSRSDDSDPIYDVLTAVNRPVGVA